jgi:hypothetical protein
VTATWSTGAPSTMIRAAPRMSPGALSTKPCPSCSPARAYRLPRASLTAAR